MSQINIDFGIDESGNSVLVGIYNYNMVFNDSGNQPTEWYFMGSTDDASASSWETIEYRNNVGSSLLGGMNLSYLVTTTSTETYVAQGDVSLEDRDTSIYIEEDQFTLSKEFPSYRSVPEYKCFRFVFTGGESADAIALSEIRLIEGTTEDNDIGLFEPDTLWGYSPSGTGAYRVAMNNHKNWIDTYNSGKISSTDNIYSTYQNSIGNWNENQQTQIFIIFKEAITLRRYQFVFTDITTRPTSWVVYATNNDSAIPTGRVSGDAISIKMTNDLIVSSFSSYEQIDVQTDTTYEVAEDYTTDFGENISAYTSGSNIMTNSYAIDYETQYLKRVNEETEAIEIKVTSAVPIRSYDMNDVDLSLIHI